MALIITSSQSFIPNTVKGGRASVLVIVSGWSWQPGFSDVVLTIPIVPDSIQKGGKNAPVNFQRPVFSSCPRTKDGFLSSLFSHVIKYCSSPPMVSHLVGTCIRDFFMRSFTHSLGPKKVLSLRTTQISKISRSATVSRLQALLISRRSIVSLRIPHHRPAGLHPHTQDIRRSLASMSSAAEDQPEAASTSTSTSTENGGASDSSTDAKPAFPPLSAHEHRQYNRLAEHMNYYV